MNDSFCLKSGEEMIRLCRKERKHVNKAGIESSFAATHDFTMFSDVFTATDIPAHISALYDYLAKVFISGCPQRDSTASQTAPNTALKLAWTKSDLVAYAAAADYRRFGKEQHPIVQRHLKLDDPLTIALEVPLFDGDSNGFADIVRIHPAWDWMIEIADFKPDLPASAKRTPAFPMATKKMQQIAAQLDKYRRMLIERTGVPADKVFCTAFDDEAAFVLL